MNIVSGILITQEEIIVKNLKKIIALACAAAMVFTLAACGSNSGNAQTTGADADKTYTIGICQLVQHAALDAATQGFKDALTEKLGDKVTFDEQNAAGDSATCSTICSTFVTNGVDLIMANATPALQAAASSTGDIPIIGTSVTDYAAALGIDAADWKGYTETNISGISDGVPAADQAEIIEEMFPDAENIGILYCSAEANSKVQADDMRNVLTGMGLTVSDFTFADSNDVAAVTQNACDACDLIYIPTDNTAANCVETINNVASVAKVPIIAGEENICRGCGVATLSINYYDIGTATGNLAYKVLVEGADISTLEIGYADKVTKEYNKENCELLGVQVPEGYTEVPAAN